MTQSNDYYIHIIFKECFGQNIKIEYSYELFSMMIYKKQKRTTLPVFIKQLDMHWHDKHCAYKKSKRNKKTQQLLCFQVEVQIVSAWMKIISFDLKAGF